MSRLYLPTPYDGECLSSVLTRAGKYFGRDIRMMSYACFGEHSLCHPQYPKHVPIFAEHLGGKWTADWLIQRHTMYPLTAPFIEEALRARLLDWMAGNPSGERRAGGRMFSGTQLATYRYCPACWREQQKLSKGDMGWLLIWQLPQCPMCLKHGEPLLDTGVAFRDRYSATQNVDWSDMDLSAARPLKQWPHARLMTETAAALMERPLERLPTSGQWDEFWRRRLSGTTNRMLRSAGEAFWGQECLSALGVATDRTLLKGVGRRVWWKALLMLKALNPDADLLLAIDEAASLKERTEV